MNIKPIKPIGKVTHYFPHIKVGIVKFSLAVKVGVIVRFEGATTDFSQPIESMQFNHKQVKVALKGKQMGLKVKKRVREGDLVYLVQPTSQKSLKPQKKSKVVKKKKSVSKKKVVRKKR